LAKNVYYPVCAPILDYIKTSFRFILCGSSARKLRAIGANLLPGPVYFTDFILLSMRNRNMIPDGLAKFCLPCPSRMRLEHTPRLKCHFIWKRKSDRKHPFTIGPPFCIFSDLPPRRQLCAASNRADFALQIHQGWVVPNYLFAERASLLPISFLIPLWDLQ
jgi:hypothetical protein